MIKSMTGYGKGECSLSNSDKITVEIKSLNSKNADIIIKSPIVTKEKELKIRKLLQESLVRGTIDVSINYDTTTPTRSKRINGSVFEAYMSQLKQLTNIGESENALIATAILRLPDVVDSKPEELTEADWKKIETAIRHAARQLDKYRTTEGKALLKDINKRVKSILKFLEQVKKEDASRGGDVRKRLTSKIEQSGYATNPERLEQELIFYLEKLDITEEKVRLAQHCSYFLKTIQEDAYPGKKMGFIVQEMGREINTIGSKANNAKIQALVVKMKDELEKIREQSMNVL